jgi:starvation-inducible DNA-binding protein
MYNSQLDIAEPVRRASIALLQARLATAIDLQAQLRQAHWNVKGHNFLQLHELFDKIHSVLGDFVDILAERIMALQGGVDGRLQVVVGATTLDQYPIDAVSGEDHLRAVSRGLSRFGAAVREDIETSAAGGDAGTADVFTEISRAMDKQLWLVEAHLHGSRSL